jgi:hypothetical protein
MKTPYRKEDISDLFAVRGQRRGRTKDLSSGLATIVEGLKQRLQNVCALLLAIDTELVFKGVHRLTRSKSLVTETIIESRQDQDANRKHEYRAKSPVVGYHFRTEALSDGLQVAGVPGLLINQIR